MAASTTTPVIVGVGDVKNSSLKPEDAVEPLHLILQAIRAAADDTGVPVSRGTTELLAAVDSIDIVPTWTWPYANLPGSIAQHIGARPQHTSTTPQGGSSSIRFLDDVARRISKNESGIAVIAGGEALASCMLKPQLGVSGLCEVLES